MDASMNAANYSRIVYCPECSRNVVGVAHGSYDNPNAHYLGPYEESYHRYALVSCSECKHPFLTVETGHPEGSCFTGPWVLYPQCGETISSGVPEPIRKCFYEAQQCYNERHYRATSVLCRAVVELIAKEKGITEGNLEKKIDLLLAQGFLNQDLSSWAHAIRFFGNAGAHELEPGIDQTQAKDALDLVHATMEFVYSLRDMYEMFQAARKARNAKAGNPG